MASQFELDNAITRSEPLFGSRRLQGLLGRDWKVAFPFVLPMALIMLGLVLWPFINAIIMSTTALNFLTGQEYGVGLQNYQDLLGDFDYQVAIRNTIQFTFWSLAVKFVVGMTIALVLNSRIPFRGVLTAIMLMPWVVPEVVTALAWKSIYDPIFGGLDPLLMKLGLADRAIGWLSEKEYAMPSVIAVNVWKGIPFYTLLLLSGLKAVDHEQLEAAEVDGANAVQRFRHVTLPSLRYVIVVVLLLSFISTFNQFGLVYLLTVGGPGNATTLYSILAYQKAVVSLQYGQGAAIALSVAPLMAILIWLLAKYMRHDDRQSGTRSRFGFGDQILKGAGWLLSAAIDLFFLPFELIFSGVEWLIDAFKRVIGRPTNQVMLKLPQRRRLSLWMRLLVLLPVMLFVLFPFYWVFVTSFKSDPQITQRFSIFWPDPFTLDQFTSLISETPFLIWFRNSTLVALGSTVVSVALASLGAYALSRLKFRGAGLLTSFLMITYLLPGTLIFIPLYKTLTDLGIVNTWAALIVTYPTFLLPFATWVLMGYFRSIPVELEEAAMIDGASRLYAFWHVILPLAAPAVLAVSLFAFTTAWNEFLFAFVFITTESLRTLPVGLQSMVIGDILPWGQLMAASLLTAVPVAILYIFAQRFLVEGLTVGAVKG